MSDDLEPAECPDGPHNDPITRCIDCGEPYVQVSAVRRLLDDVNPSHHHWSADDAEQAAFEKGMEVAKREGRRELDQLDCGGDTGG